MGEQYGVYLEIQRGGWDSRRALQRQKPQMRQFAEWANAFDLMKVYGSGWLAEPGLAFGKNAPFLPNGSVFKRIMNHENEDDEKFGVEDLYAAYRLQRANDCPRLRNLLAITKMVMGQKMGGQPCVRDRIFAVIED